MSTGTYTSNTTHTIFLIEGMCTILVFVKLGYAAVETCDTCHHENKKFSSE